MDGVELIDLANINVGSEFKDYDSMLLTLVEMDRVDKIDINSIISQINTHSKAVECGLMVACLYETRPKRRQQFLEIFQEICNAYEDIPSIIDRECGRLFRHVLKKKSKGKKKKENLMYNAILNDDVRYLQEVMNQPGFNIQARTYDRVIQYKINKFSCTLLEQAAFYGSPQCFKLLLLNKAENFEDTAELAVAGGNHEIIHLLEQHGANFSTGCLFTAVAFIRIDIFDWLIMHLDYMIKIDEKMPPVYAFVHSFSNLLRCGLDAINSRFYRFYVFCLKFDKSVNQTKQFFKAAHHGCLPLLKFHFKGANLKSVEKLSGNNALHLAAINNSTDCVNFLLDNGFSSKTVNKEGMNALQIAVLNGSIDVVKLFKERGVSIVEKTFRIPPLVSLAVQSNKLRLVKYLVENGSPLSSSPKRPNALHIAAQKSSIKIINYLMDTDKRLEKQADEKGMLPIHYAAMRGRAYIVGAFDRSLLSKKDRFGNIPLHYASMSGQYTVTKYCYCNYKAGFNVRNNDNCTPFDISTEYSKYYLIGIKNLQAQKKEMSANKARLMKRPQIVIEPSDDEPDDYSVDYEEEESDYDLHF